MIIWIFSILIFFQSPAKEELTYDIFFRDNDIGDYHVTRTSVNGGVEYQSHSIARVQILGSVELELTKKVRFKRVY